MTDLVSDTIDAWSWDFGMPVGMVKKVKLNKENGHDNILFGEVDGEEDTLVSCVYHPFRFDGISEVMINDPVQGLTTFQYEEKTGESFDDSIDHDD